MKTKMGGSWMVDCGGLFETSRLKGEQLEAAFRAASMASRIHGALKWQKPPDHLRQSN